MIDSVRTFVRRHRRSTSGVYLFSIFMTFLYAPYDIFLKPLLRGGIDSAEEVWFGVMLVGWDAKLTEPIHWAIYASLVYGFSKERPWAWALASLYTVQVAIGSAIWVVLYASYGTVGYVATALVVAAFLWLAALLWRDPARRAQRELTASLEA